MRKWMSPASLALVLAALPVAAWAGPPFLTDDPYPTPHHHYEVFAFASASPAHGDVSGAYGLDFNYGAGPDLQLSATAPIVYDRPDGGDTRSALGNVELAAKLRLVRQGSAGWSVAVFPRLFLPSDSDLAEKRASFLLPVWVGKSGENWSAFGGGGCALHRGDGARDYCIAGGAYTQRVAANLTLGSEVFHQTADARDAKASTILGLGATYDFNETLHWLAYWGSEIENPHENGRGVAYTSLLFTF